MQDNSHEAIVDQEMFDIVQRIRDGRRRWTPMGEMPILSGMLFCADCGSKLYQCRGRRMTHEREFFVCARYRKRRGGCINHSIRNVAIETLLLDGIRDMTAFARDHEDAFVELVMQKKKAALTRDLRDGERELEQAQARS